MPACRMGLPPQSSHQAVSCHVCCGLTWTHLTLFLWAGNVPEPGEGAWGAGPAGLYSQECPLGHGPALPAWRRLVITEFG